MPSTSASRPRIAFGLLLLAVGVSVFAVRMLHEGAYPVPRGGNLFGGVGGLLLGGLLVAPGLPSLLRWLALAASPVVLFLGLYATMAELEEVVSLYATDSAGRPAELRLWIVDREDGSWLGMPREKATEHALDGAPIEMLRGGAVQCVVPVVHEERATVRAIHALKLEKYAVARAASAIGLYPSTPGENSVSLHLGPCPAS